MADNSAMGGVRRTFRQIGVIRLLITLLLLAGALVVARYSWQAPLLSDAERALYDIRFTRSVRQVGQDNRITLVTFTDEQLRELRQRSPLPRNTIANALRMINSLNPRAVGIDILFDSPQDSVTAEGEQTADEQLIAALRGMTVPTFVAFTTNQANPDQMQAEGEQFLREFLGQVSNQRVRPASILLSPDLEDGVVRRWPERPDGMPATLVNSMAPEAQPFGRYSGSLAFRMPQAEGVDTFTELPISALADIYLAASAPDITAEERNALVGEMRSAIQGRYILIGGNIIGSDDFETPMTRQSGQLTKGLVVHAQMLAQALDNDMPTPIAPWILWIAAVVVVLLAAVTAILELRSYLLVPALIVELAIIAAVPFLLADQHMDTLALPAAGWVVGWVFAFVGVSIAARAIGSEQKNFAQSALGKYLPADVASEIMRDPDRLSLQGERREIYALFSDLEGFTKLSHAIEPETLSALLNRYLDMLSDTVLEHGGTIDKFVGDAVVAFWGAPIAREDDADRAALAAIAMYEVGEKFRTTAAADYPDLPPIGVTRVGLHLGEAVVGNFGGQRRIQYTALGDGMNTAARLESANKALKTIALVSGEAVAHSSLDVFRPMGRIVLSGRSTPIEVWEPAARLPTELRRRLKELWLEFDSGDQSALARVEAVAAERPDDAALQNFVYRLREAGPGGHFVLGSK